MAVSLSPRLLATVRARALQRQLAVRKLLVVMEVEEKRAVAAMLLLVRAPMRVRSLGMEVRTVQLVIQPRETKAEMRVGAMARKMLETRVRKREETKAEMRVGKRPVVSPRTEKGPMTMQLETMLPARAERVRNPRALQLRLQCSALTPSVRARIWLLGMRKQLHGRCRV